MRPAKIEGDARPIGAPANWDEGKAGRCGALFVRRETHGPYVFMTSAWEASADQAGWILAGAKVELGISAPQHPVVRMGTGPVTPDSLPVFTIRQCVTLDGKHTVRATMYAPPAGDKSGGSAWGEVTVDGDLVDAIRDAVKFATDTARDNGVI